MISSIIYNCSCSYLIERHSISRQSFADDTLLLESCHPDHVDTTVQHMQNCFSEVKLWMDCNKLKLSDEKKMKLFWSIQTELCSLILHPILFELVALTFHSLLMQEISRSQSYPTQPWTSMSQTSADPPTLSLPWISRHKLHLPPSDSQCNQNSPLCLWSLKVRLLQLPPLWLTPIQSGQASKSTKFCSKVSNEIPQVWSCTASFAQPSLVTSTLKDWLQDFDPALQHFHRLLFRLSLSFYTSTPLQDTSVHPQTQEHSVFLS